MEPEKGKIDWTQSDLIFHAVKARGLDMDLVIRSAPSWAAGVTETPDHNYAPNNPAAYGNICYQIAKRYLHHGVNITFELGNEENTQFFNMPKVDPAGYTKNMLIPGSKGIRKAAKELGVTPPTILIGGFAPVDPEYVPNSVAPLDYMKEVYANGGQGWFDSIAYHPYTYVSEPALHHWSFVELKAIVALMNSKGDTNRKIWATEAGFATGSGTGEINEVDQAKFTGEELDLWFSLPYAGPLLWYELADNQSHDDMNRENTFGLLYSGTPWTAKPAFQVFMGRAEERINKANHGG